MEKNNKKIIWIGLAFSLFFFLIFVFTKNIDQDINSSPSLPIPTKIEKGAQASLEIGNTRYEAEVIENGTVYEFMEKLRDEGKIDFKAKTYTGMGEFIEEINGVKGNNENYWIYYVNNKKAEVGVSNYKVSPGDVVSWKYESSY